MADLGFLPGVKRILDRTPRHAQRLLFSATLDNGIDVLVKRYLHNPVTHSVDPAVAPVSTMTHHVLAVEKDDKAAVVRELASGRGRTLLFMRTKHTAKKLARQLTANGIPAVDLHGNLSQNARERNLEAFSSGAVKVLVATDIAARGIHVDDVGLVVHVDPPAEHKAYLHRSGRTARAGAEGVVVTVMTPDQTADVRTLTRQAGISPVRSAVAPGAPVLRELTGPRAELVPADQLPAAIAQTPAQTPARQPSGGQGRGGAGRADTVRAKAPASRPAAGSGRSGGGSAGQSGPSGRGTQHGQQAPGAASRRRRRPRRSAA
jgi:superfamily II DNA/RNA helicase